MSDEKINTANDCMVGTGPNGGVTIMMMGGARLDRDKALRLAAWIVALVDDGEDKFPAVLDAVLNT